MEPKEKDSTQDTHNASEASASEARPRRFKMFLLALVILLVGGGVVTGIMLTKHEANNQDSEASAPSAQVIIGTGEFTPATIQVKKGQGVVWINQDDQPHTLSLSGDDQSADGLGGPEQINQGESYSYVFNQPGTYDYHDANDPLRFKGVIVVE